MKCANSHVARMEKSEVPAEFGEETLRPGHKWEYNTKLHLKVIG